MSADTDVEVVARAELLPCPFCGGAATMEAAKLVRDTYWWVTCRNERCTVKCHSFQSLKKADAITAWNTRAAMSADPRVKVLEEALADAAAHLTAAASAYRKHASRSATLKPRAVADAFFSTRAKDFEKAAERVCTTLSRSRGGEK